MLANLNIMVIIKIQWEQFCMMLLMILVNQRLVFQSEAISLNCMQYSLKQLITLSVITAFWCNHSNIFSVKLFQKSFKQENGVQAYFKCFFFLDIKINLNHLIIPPHSTITVWIILMKKICTKLLVNNDDVNPVIH